jgi:low temperature requirement protein LtrA
VGCEAGADGVRPARYLDAVDAEQPEAQDTLGRRFKRWFWRPPRPHGEIIADRTVSSLELFYDLVYVAVVAQAAHHLAEHVTGRAVAEFAVVFSMIWIAWVNGTLYLELHGREDGRTRSTVFLQMGILVLLAVFTAEAAGDGDDGMGFALTYTVFLAVTTWLWNSVRRQDRRNADATDFSVDAGYYVAGMALSMVTVLVSAFLPSGPRVVLWAVYAAGWVAGMALVGVKRALLSRVMPPTHSLIERFGLFTIIVLGEVVVGVVAGLSTPERDAQVTATGMIALTIGFGFWWIYFDIVGSRPPRREAQSLTSWLLGHLPITMSIAAAGAAMVSLIAHAGDDRTPAGTAWLLAGAVAVGLVALTIAERTLVDADRLSDVYRPLTLALVAGGAAALVVGWARPAPWLLALLLVGILLVVWVFAVNRFLRADAWGSEPARAGVDAG